MLVNSNDDIKTIVAFSAGVISSILYHVSIYTLFVKTAQGWGWHSLWRSLVLQEALNTPRWQLAEFAPLGNGKMKLEVPLSPLISLLVFIKRQYPLFLVLTGLPFERNKRRMHAQKKYMQKFYIKKISLCCHLSHPKCVSVVTGRYAYCLATINSLKKKKHLTMRQRHFLHPIIFYRFFPASPLFPSPFSM